MDAKKGILVRGTDKSINFNLDEDGCITLECLQSYFSNANGLTYEENGAINALLIKDRKIFIKEKISVYDVHYGKGENLILEYTMNNLFF